jgi:predicted permease
MVLSTVPARTREMALRIAMGAPRFRLLRQLMLESVILSAGGALVGLVIASWFAGFVSSIRLGSELAIGFQPQVDERVVAFTFAVALVSAFMSGAIPAWRCTRGDLNSLLKSSDPRNRVHKTWGRQILVGAQVAVASLFLIACGFLLEQFQQASNANPGFRVDHVLTMSFNPAIAGYDVQKSRAFYATLMQRLGAIPGVKSAAIAQDKPFGVINNASTSLTIEGYELPSSQQSIQIRTAFVGNGYFETLKIPVIRGRAFDRRDTADSPRTVIINEAMANEYWPSRDPIGARVEIKRDDGGPAEVIGIARTAKYGGMDERPMPFLYRSYDQSMETYAALFVETEGRPETLTSAVSNEIRSIAPTMPIFEVRTMEDHFHQNGLLNARLNAQIMTPLGGVALVLGVLGLYGVIAYSVSQRTYEIGIRIAVGASNRQVMRMVLFQGLSLSGIATAIGFGLALVLRPVIGKVPEFANPNDPTVYLGVLALMLLVTGAACYIPARRASMVDPNITLRT